MISLTSGLSLLIMFFMIANFWNVLGLFSFLLEYDLNFILTSLCVLFLIAPLMIYKITASYFILFDFKFFGLYGVKSNQQSDKMSILNVSTILSWFTLPLVNSFYTISLSSDQIDNTTYSQSLELLSFPKINDKSITLYINFAMIPLTILIIMISSKRISKKVGLEKYKMHSSIPKQMLINFAEKMNTEKETNIDKLSNYFRSSRLEHKEDLDLNADLVL
jgi:hypothetical protein